MVFLAKLRDTCIPESQEAPAKAPVTFKGAFNKFAADIKADLLFLIDPQGKFAAEVNADKALGQKVGIQHTPTIYIVSSRNRGRPVVEVTDSTQLFQMIEAVQAE